MKHILAVDQGTSSSRAIVFDSRLNSTGMAQREIEQYYPKPGWVEHDAQEIWESVLATSREAIANARISGSDISCIGITNQRETIVVWDRKSGAPVHRAIVWQDRRTSDHVAALREIGREPDIQARTGLVLDAYFSASKLHWLLREIPNGRARAEAGELAAGTIDSWLIFRLTHGRSHVTDVTNASRTMLMNLESGTWDPEMLGLFDIPAGILPEIRPTSGALGIADSEYFGAEIPITAAIGDQQAALFGQLCTKPGMVKCTYGTGCFMLLHTGQSPVKSENRLLTTVAWQIGKNPREYAIEGSIFMGGASIQWLRDGLKIIKSTPDVNALAASVSDSGGVIVVPAFTGLGAPYWDAEVTGTVFGLRRGTTAAHIARATLDGIAFQVSDLVSVMGTDTNIKISTLRVDGGACASDLLMQTQADILGVSVERPTQVESTAIGAAMMAGLAMGIWADLSELEDIRQIDRVFTTTVPSRERKRRITQWKNAVRLARRWRS
ncbi:MAG: glycerol kinase GlpK [Chthoniobacterales bacterium]